MDVALTSRLLHKCAVMPCECLQIQTFIPMHFFFLQRGNRDKAGQHQIFLKIKFGDVRSKSKAWNETSLSINTERS